MRLIPVLLVSLALASSAGCFGKDDPGDDPVITTPTGTTTPATGATPTATPTSGTPNNNASTPTKPAAREVFTDAPTFQNAPGPSVPPDPAHPTGPPTTKPFPVPAGYTKLTLNVTWASTSPAGAGVSGGISIAITDAAGTAIATCAGPGQGPQPSVPEPCMAEGAIPAGTAATDYNAVYTGSGTFSATVSVVAS